MTILQEIFVPQESVNDQILTVVNLNFNTGDRVKKNDIVLELETSKAIVTIEADTDGYVVYHCKLNEDVPLNALVAQIISDSPQHSIENVIETAPPPSLISDEVPLKTYDTQFSKKALFLLESHNLSKELFENYDFVNEKTILNYLHPIDVKTKAPSSVTDHHLKNKNTINKEWANVSFEKLSPGKRREIEYLSSIQGNSLVSTLYINIDTEGLGATLNKQLNYFKTSILPIVVFETAKLLNKYPLLNSFYTDDQIGKYNNINIGIAMDIDDGLKVVKIPGTCDLGILEIEEKIFQLSNKYLDKKLEVSDLTDITFTITDLSATDLYFFTPLINKNNAAILGISKTNEKFHSCILSLSFDHRVTEGKYAGEFLTELKTRLESFALFNNEATNSLVCYKCLKNISEDPNDVGFIKVQTKAGGEKLICDTCLLN